MAVDSPLRLAIARLTEENVELASGVERIINALDDTWADNGAFESFGDIEGMARTVATLCKRYAEEVDRADEAEADLADARAILAAYAFKPSSERAEKDIWSEVAAERARAHALHADMSMEAQPVDSLLRLAILMEEVGEVAREFNEARHGQCFVNLDQLRQELIQVAAMAGGWADRITPESRNQVHHLTPERVEAMCHWFAYSSQPLTHAEFHWGFIPGQTGVCPYFAVAEVMRGHEDPRDRESAVNTPKEAS